MTQVRYCTPEWLEESGKNYRSDPAQEEQLKKLSAKICYRVKAEPAWGIEKDLLFGIFIQEGRLTRISFFSEEAAKEEAEYILAAAPPQWKKILRKESKFLTDFMLGKVKLEKGNRVTVLGLAPYAPTVVDTLTRVEIQFPDEMSAEELARYRAYLGEFRQRLGV